MMMALMPKGIQALINKISLLGEVYVVAPDGERSASSQAITMNKPIRVDEVELRSRIHRLEY